MLEPIEYTGEGLNVRDVLVYACKETRSQAREIIKVGIYMGN